MIPILMAFLFLFFAMNFCFLDSDGWILDSDWTLGFRWGLGWAGGHGGGVVVTVVGHVWSSWVNMVGLFSRRWLLWWVYLVIVGPGGVCSCYVLLCSLC